MAELADQLRRLTVPAALAIGLRALADREGQRDLGIGGNQ